MRIRLVQIVNRVAAAASLAATTAVLAPLPASAEELTPDRTTPALRAKAAAVEPAAPPAPARVSITASPTDGPWTLRIDNEGARPMRIAADVRLLQLEVEPPEDESDSRAATRGARPAKKKTTRCSVPSPLRPSDFPESRALLLAPGESYVERFDPRLICFGKDAAALTAGATVKAWYGWSPPSKWAKKPAKGPFIAQSTEDPAAFAPAPGLMAPPIVLSHGPSPSALPTGEKPIAAAAPAAPADGEKPAAGEGSAAPPHGNAVAPADRSAGTTAVAPVDKAVRTPADKSTGAPVDTTAVAPVDAPAPPKENRREPAGKRPSPIVDANAPRLELTADPWSNAVNRRSLTVRFKARNIGRRSMVVALRPRMLELRVTGPNGTTVCGAAPPSGAIPRDMFTTLKPSASVDLTLLLAETCPDDAFNQGGLYRVTAVLNANEPGTALGLNGYSAIVRAKNATIVRLNSAPQPFHLIPPKAVPTSQLDKTQPK